ncbi:MAG: pyridoxal-phosphate dependent enzyme [Chloroflexota bacterium]
MRIVCLNCGRPYPDAGVPYRCPRCGGIFDDVEPLVWHDPDASQPGIWRYWRTLLPAGERVSLGEDQTPLVDATLEKRPIYFKCEYANPTGSFKDRGTAALVSFLIARGVTEAVEDSSGNAGASFAAYAARAGIHARVFVPESAAGPKRLQIGMYGAELVPVPGARSGAGYAAQRAAEAGVVYASHAFLPHNLAGYATAAFEIVEQLRGGPGAVVVPAGQGGFILGMGRGFRALKDAGVIEKLPVLVGAQAAACAPLAAYHEIGVTGLGFVTEAATIAEGVRVRSPLRIDAVTRAVHESGGRFVAIDEGHILPGRDSLARLGFYVEPTSALVWEALRTSLAQLPDPVVVVLTGSGYKWNPNQER